MMNMYVVVCLYYNVTKKYSGGAGLVMVYFDEKAAKSHAAKENAVIKEANIRKTGLMDKDKTYHIVVPVELGDEPTIDQVKAES